MGTGGVLLRKLRARVADEPTGFVWIEKGKLAGSGYPASRNQVLWLTRKGVNCIVTLTEDSIPSEFTKDLPLRVEHVAMKDHEPPSLEQLDMASRIIAEQIGAGRTVLVHCLAGQGRTMCAIAAYLIRNNGMTANEAVESLRKVRPGAVEAGQVRAVRDFEAEFDKGTRRKEAVA